MRAAFDYAVFRIVPRVEREEFINAGVVVFCPERAYLACRVALDEARVRALWPGTDIGLVERISSRCRESRTGTKARDRSPA